jgi:murein DD-endopeptidase MepM/ murein hydrolase activator NlpD
MPPRFLPVARGFYVTSPFAARWGTFHWGQDFGRGGGSGGYPIYAAQGGRVTMAGPASGFVYGHIIPEVRVGQRVEAGQRIGRINPDSNTNGGVAPHLHFEVHRSVWAPPGNDRLDPGPWLQGASWPGEAPPPPPAPAPPPRDIWRLIHEQVIGLLR